MCGRFAQGDLDAIYSKYKIKLSPDDVKPRYNIAPGSFVPVIYKEDGNIKFDKMKWGFSPSWDKEGKFKIINSGSETSSQKPIFKQAFTKRRCIIPATAYYEWKKTQNGKIPFAFIPKNNVFPLAGIYEKNDDQNLYTFAILTTFPNELNKLVHDRMPLILEEDEEKIWLDEKINDINMLETLFNAFPSDKMTTHQISKLVNNPINDSPDILKPDEKK